ncbi:MAG TPA: hypothetical protein VNV43_02635 [Candidatus Acidoferrales bacterium]|nr:hypothetical protein [Candidatus Acidoferrales bacterium]
MKLHVFLVETPRCGVTARAERAERALLNVRRYSIAPVAAPLAKYAGRDIAARCP